MPSTRETVADLEHVVTKWDAAESVGAYTVLSPSRCKACWGSLFGRGPASGVFSEIRCRVCGVTVEGEAATEEHLRIYEEGQENALRIRCGEAPRYGEGPFLQKAIVVEERLSEAEVRTRIAQKLSENRKKRPVLTRSTFPLGTAGNLYMQAKILISGVGDVYNVHGTSVAEHEIVDLADGGFKLDLTKSAGRMVQDPQCQEFEMMGRLGCQMGAAMLAAFGCELLMKAISLTCKHEASKTHDLMDLYMNLPEDSRCRIAIDYEEIADVMAEGRHVFGRWRYFANNAEPDALKNMVDLGRTLRLAKAARVLLDEATVVGLYVGATMKVQEKIRQRAPNAVRKQQIKLTIKAGESPRNKPEPLADSWTIVESAISKTAKWRKLDAPSFLSWTATRAEQEFNVHVSAGDPRHAAEEDSMLRTSTVDSSSSDTRAAKKPEC